MNKKIRIGKSKIAGKGSFAIERIPGRKKFAELSGEFCSMKELRRRVYHKEAVAYWELDTARDLGIDLTHSPGRYFNHSCRPNAYTRQVGVRVELYALRDIEPGEEITFDYRFEGTAPLGLTCRCGSCTGNPL